MFVLFMSATVGSDAEMITTRIKDIARINGLRNNQMIGYGLIVGLDGSGDSGAIAAAKSISNFLDSFGIKVDPKNMKGKNVAAVSVTAILPPFAKKGDSLDIVVSSIGDAKSLQGGMLLLTPLKAPNGKIYAVAQGAISLGGFNESSAGTEVRKNHPTIGQIPGGAILEKDITSTFLSDNNTFELVLRQSDFTTATGIAEQINLYFNDNLAAVKDPSTIEVFVPEDFRDYVMLYVARIEQLPVVPDVQAKIVINERTGTILMGGPIKILPVAVAQGNLSVSIQQNKEVIQPAVLSRGETKVVTNPTIKVTEEKLARGKLVEIRPGNSISDVIKVLNLIGASPRDMISILQAMKNAGALQAELVIM
ncbi:MAG: flagellar biosynthesis protein FlgA [Candidatus Margulisiibacteriota bacterium]|nr:MAG: flagellar biosynthesis protein FlgA [Candidatus Margulisiibacteriota bacterium]HCT85052.1 flagellar biosynthesis protein FlgA [Candidatus Margulisiibacteriota bacterium]HCY37987.1 flagellar biosynthesis protein FlgA [Candidatus Margulisiibacteriota bacterium]